MKKYYKLSNGSTGKPLASYARPQPHIEGLVKLEECPFEHGIYDGEKWMEDIKEKAKKDLASTDSVIQERGIDDILEMLIAKGVITEDDIPNELKTKYNDRKALRDEING